jgi:hypothetical protein
MAPREIRSTSWRDLFVFLVLRLRCLNVFARNLFLITFSTQ